MIIQDLKLKIDKDKKLKSLTQKNQNIIILFFHHLKLVQRQDHTN